MNSCPELKIDWATHNAAKYACENWHYSRSVPCGKLVKIGAWENGQFIGVVIFSKGANLNIGSPYKLTQYEVCELTRVAFKNHQTPVSRVLGIALRFLKKMCPGIRLVVSYADADQNHHGGIYQATNWIYEGLVNYGTPNGFIVNGKKVHPRTIGSMGGGIKSLQWVRKHMDPSASKFITSGKHKYLMPLDKSLQKQLQRLGKPYPKRASSVESGTSSDQGERGGESPTDAHHFNKKRL